MFVQSPKNLVPEQTGEIGQQTLLCGTPSYSGHFCPTLKSPGEQGADVCLPFVFIVLYILFSELAALAFDYMGSYEIAFYAAGIPPIVAATLMFLIPKKRTQLAKSVSSKCLEDKGFCFW